MNPNQTSTQLIDKADTVRKKLRTIQARSTMDGIHPIQAIQEIILGVTWRVMERLSGERLPR